MKRTFRSNSQCGLTLVELIIALAVLAVIVMLAVPAFARLQGNYQLSSTAHRLAAAINLARAEALTRRLPVSLCPVDGPAGAVCSGDYSRGWVVFTNAARDRVLDAGQDEIIRLAVGLPPGYTASNRLGSLPATNLITYNADGSARRNQTLLFCAPPAARSEPYSIVLNLAGRVRVSRGEGQCPGGV